MNTAVYMSLCVCLCGRRSFSKQRSAIEKEYSQNLLRLVQQFVARRDIKDPPDIAAMDRLENRSVGVREHCQKQACPV